MNLNPTDLFALDNGLLAGVTDLFIRHDRGRCLSHWPRGRVELYLLFHARQNTLAFIPVDGEPSSPPTLRRPQSILAAAVGWQTEEAILRKFGACAAPFTWQATDPAGDSFLVADLCLAPAARVQPLRSRILSELIGFYRAGWGWRGLKLFGIRNGRLLEISDHYLSKLTP